MCVRAYVFILGGGEINDLSAYPHTGLSRGSENIKRAIKECDAGSRAALS